jgi:predicted nuclease of predicted toxin-antitoxin system
MKILFDNGTPKPIAAHLPGHEVALARRIGWHELRNGELLQQAEVAGFDLLLTTDKNLRYQQNLSGRRITIVVLGNSQWPDVRIHMERVIEAILNADPGSYVEVDIPHRLRR